MAFCALSPAGSPAHVFALAKAMRSASMISCAAVVRATRSPSLSYGSWRAGSRRFKMPSVCATIGVPVAGDPTPHTSVSWKGTHSGSTSAAVASCHSRAKFARPATSGSSLARDSIVPFDNAPSASTQEPRKSAYALLVSVSPAVMPSAPSAPYSFSARSVSVSGEPSLAAASANRSETLKPSAARSCAGFAMLAASNTP